MSDESDLGLNGTIHRRDFLGMVLAGTACPGRLAFGAGHQGPGIPDPAWALGPAAFDGFSGIGDYAGHNGNTYATVNAAHRVRDGIYRDYRRYGVTDLDETVDLVCVGGGPAGLFSAYLHARHRPNASSLILENHGIFGGLAKRNEMDVDGARIIAPQCSNVFVSDPSGNERLIDPEVLEDLGLNAAVDYAYLSGTDSPLDFDRTNFVYYYPPMRSRSIGYFYPGDAGYTLVRDPVGQRFEAPDIPAQFGKEFTRWRFETEIPAERRGDIGWLDGMTYHEYLKGVHGFSEEFCRIIDRWIGGGKAFNGSMCSAYALTFNRYPGLKLRPDYALDGYFERVQQGSGVRIDGFPGGNAFVARQILARLIPEAFDRPGGSLVPAAVDFASLDLPGRRHRLRLGATVVAVEHDGDPAHARTARVVYEKDGRLYRVRARLVILASGAWVNRHVVRDAPPTLGAALASLKHAPTLVANVALRHWRFMENAGVTACLWHGGEFGFQCNLRRPATTPDYTPPLDPDRPIFLTFYAPFVYPGLDTETQLARGRGELFTTPFREFERRIRRQLAAMFGPYGLDPARDIAGIILNRWGHAYVVPEPGFFTGVGGAPAPRDVIREGYGRVRFAHSELRGFQSIESAYLESRRAVESLL